MKICKSYQIGHTSWKTGISKNVHTKLLTLLLLYIILMASLLQMVTY